MDDVELDDHEAPEVEPPTIAGELREIRKELSALRREVSKIGHSKALC